MRLHPLRAFALLLPFLVLTGCDGGESPAATIGGEYVATVPFSGGSTRLTLSIPTATASGASFNFTITEACISGSCTNDEESNTESSGTGQYTHPNITLNLTAGDYAGTSEEGRVSDDLNSISFTTDDRSVTLVRQ